MAKMYQKKLAETQATPEVKAQLQAVNQYVTQLFNSMWAGTPPKYEIKMYPPGGWKYDNLWFQTFQIDIYGEPSQDLIAEFRQHLDSLRTAWPGVEIHFYITSHQ